MRDSTTANVKDFHRQVVVAFGAVSLIIAGLVGAVWKMSQEAGEAAKWVTHTYQVLDGLAQIQLDTLRIELATQGLQVTNDSARAAERDSALQSRERSLQQVTQLTLDNPLHQDRLQVLRTVFAEAQAVTGRPGALALGAPGVHTRARAQRILAEMEAQERELLGERLAERRSRELMLVAAGSVAAVVVALLLLAAHIVIRRQLAVSDAARQDHANSERRLQATLQSIGEGVISTDTQARLVHMNPAAEALTGWRTDAARGRPVSDVLRVVSEATREPVPLSVQEVIDTGRPRDSSGHALLVARDGRECPIAQSAAPLRDLDGQVAGVVLVFRDISTEREMERLVRDRNTDLEREVAVQTHELRESQAKLETYQAELEALVNQRTGELELANRELKALFDNAPVGIMVTRHRRVISCNRKLEVLLGYEPGGLLGLSTRSWFTSDEQFAAIGHEISTTLSRRQAVAREIQLLQKDGTRRWFRFWVQALGPRDTADLALTILEDASHDHEAMELLEQQKERAIAENAAKGSFLANMSHEIRTPLNAITGMAQLMRRQEMPPDQADRLGKIEFAAEHLLSVVNDILDLSKIDAGKFLLDDLPLQVDEVVHNVVALLQERAAAKQIELRAELEELPRHLCGDATRVQQCLLNYAGNAIKFTPSGRITLRTQLVSDGDHGAVVRFEVADTGLGIDPADMERLFAAFEQADNSTTRQYGGTGLGLAITRKLASLMGGEAGAVSTPGEGSTFWFTVRLRKQAGDELPATRHDWEDGERLLREQCAGARVLLTDDDPINRELTSIRLREAGLLVDQACDGLEAVEKASHSPYDLVLMDMQMPRMDGLEATRHLRRLARFGDTPVVAMTANAFAEDRIRCLEAGMNDFIPKPCTPEQFYGTVVAWLRPGAQAN